MPTAANFRITPGATSDDLNKFNLSLSHLALSSYATAVMTQAANSGVTITFVHNGEDAYDPSTHTIFWDPDSALTVKDEFTGGAKGVQSAALGLLHEAAHATDPNYWANKNEPNATYGNDEEAYATNVENSVAAVLGEPERYNHDALSFPVATNPTTFTNSENYWEQRAPNGSYETGDYWNGITPAATETFGSGGCVEISSHLPGEFKAGDVGVGDVLQLSDERTLEAGSGVVSYSKRKEVDGFRIATESGVTLVCSDTAPIPTPDGLLTPKDLLGKQVPVRIDAEGKTYVRWERVVAVEPVGRIHVQHITVGDKCFWAGERAGAYILHHNLKATDPPGWWGDDSTVPDPSTSNSYTHYSNHTGEISLVGTSTYYGEGVIVR